MLWKPSTVASWPVTGTMPFSLFFLSTPMTAFARPSFAASTPRIFGCCRSICSKITPPSELTQSGTDWSGPLVYSAKSYFGCSTES